MAKKKSEDIDNETLVDPIITDEHIDSVDDEDIFTGAKGKLTNFYVKALNGTTGECVSFVDETILFKLSNGSVIPIPADCFEIL